MKKIISISIILVMLFSMFIPLTVFADGDTTTIHITFNSEGSDATLSAANGGEEFVVTVDNNDSFINFDSSSNSPSNLKSVQIVCSTSTECEATIVVTSGTGVTFASPGDSAFEFNMDTSNITEDVNITIRGREAHQPFNGSAYLIWSCNGKVCMHHFHDADAIEVRNSGVFIPANSIVDDIGHTERFDINAELKFFADDHTLGDWERAYRQYKNMEENAPIDYSEVDPEILIGDPIDMREWEDKSVEEGVCTREVDEDTFHGCVDSYVASQGVFNTRAQLRPVNEPMLNNAYVSYGDRQFKVIIYNDEFRALSIGSLEGLSYYPGAWENELTRQDAYDVSGTTKENPVVIETILLENTVNLKSLDYNGFSVKSMEALDVPENAVNVTKNNDGSFRLVFASRFYDKVVFKVTDEQDHVYYVRIKRMAIDAWINRTQEGVNVSADIYYDNRTSYTDYKYTIKIVYKDGRTKVDEMVNSQRIDDGLLNLIFDYEVDEEQPSRPEWPHGKGLKRANYHYEISESEAKKIDKVYVNVEKSGSTSNSYAGVYAGSGKGEVLDFSELRWED